MSYLVCQCGAGRYKSVWQGHRENEHEPFVHLSHPSATFLTELMMAVGHRTLTLLLLQGHLHSLARGFYDLCYLFPALCTNDHHKQSSEDIQSGLPNIVKRTLLTQPYLNLGDSKHFTNTNSAAFFKAWVRGGHKRRLDSPRGLIFILMAGNLSGASICNNPVKISGLGNHVPTFQIKKKRKQRAIR